MDNNNNSSRPMPVRALWNAQATPRVEVADAIRRAAVKPEIRIMNRYTVREAGLPSVSIRARSHADAARRYGIAELFDDGAECTVSVISDDGTARVFDVTAAITIDYVVSEVER